LSDRLTPRSAEDVVVTSALAANGVNTTDPATRTVVMQSLLESTCLLLLENDALWMENALTEEVAAKTTARIAVKDLAMIQVLGCYSMRDSVVFLYWKAIL
jgi:hypothetical protein